MKFDTIILDVESYLYRACTACKILHQESEFVFVEKYNIGKGIDYLVGVIEGFKNKFSSNNIVIVLGDKDNNFRKEINHKYKSHRGAKPLMYDMIVDWMCNKYEVITLPTLEADDTCRIVYEDNNTWKGSKVIVTIDKDFYTVPCNLYRDNIKDNKVVTITEEDARINLYRQILTGDKTDGYDGIKGIGPKQAEKLITKDTTIEELKQIFLDNNLTEKDFNINYLMAKIASFNEYDFIKHSVKKEVVNGIK